VEAAVTGYVDLALRFRREVKVLFQDVTEMTNRPVLAGVAEMADRLVDALAGRSAEPEARVRAHMVLGAVFVTCASDLQVPDEVLRDEMVRGALRTLGHTPR